MIPENIAHLKASIAVLGLLQPLLVQKLDGKYAVLAGGRRHAALRSWLPDKSRERGSPAKTKIDCRLVPDDCDVTTGAVARREHHPGADECHRRVRGLCAG